MGIDIRINIELKPWQKKIIRAGVVTGAVIGAMGIGVALAGGIDTSWVTPNAPLTAANLLASLTGLQTQITAIQSQVQPPGTLLAFAGTACPPGTVPADGSSVQRVGTYANLFQALSTTYGSTSGTTFNLPNASGVFLRGAGTQTIHGLAYTGTQGMSLNDTTKVNGLAQTFHDPGHVHAFDYSTNSYNTGAGSAYVSTGNNNNTAADQVSQLSVQSMTTGITLGTGDSETSPANISVLYCLWY